MIDALRYEWVRLRTLRSTYWLTGAGVVLSMIVAGAVAYFTRNSGDDAGTTGIVLTGGIPFTPLPIVAVFMGLIGVLAFGHEYRHGTILSTLAAVPRRNRLVVAKLLVVTVWSLVTAVVSVLLNWAVGNLLGQTLSLTDDLVLPAMVGYVLYVGLWGVLGLGLAALVRNLPVAIVIILVVPLMVEPLLSAIALLPAFEDIRAAFNYLPFSAGSRMGNLFDVNSIAGAEGAASPFGTPPSRLVSGLTFTAWIAAVFLPAWVLFHRRDA
jgi:ABC-2 type transport system permease protein